MNQKILLILSIFVISTFAESGRIAGGEEAELGQFPYHVKIEPSSGSFRRLCGGALIKYNWVITIAQCIFNVNDVIVRLGVIDRLVGPEGAVFWVTNRQHIIVHEDYTGDPLNPEDYTNDIGLIYLENASEVMFDVNINGTKLISTVELPPHNNIDLDYAPGVVTGFGFYEDGENALQSMKLRFARMVILPQTICSQNNPRVTDDNFCTDHSQGKATCVGDEGGPFVMEYEDKLTVVGLVGTTFSNCNAAYPSIFTNLLSFYDWIMETITNPPQPPTTTTKPPNNGENCKCECHCYTCPKNDTTTTNNFWDE